MNNDEGRFLYNYLQVYVTPEKWANRKPVGFQHSAVSTQHSLNSALLNLLHNHAWLNAEC